MPSNPHADSDLVIPLDNRYRPSNEKVREMRERDLVIPLDNRYRPSNEKVREMRERANQRRKQREEANRKAIA